MNTGGFLTPQEAALANDALAKRFWRNAGYRDLKFVDNGLLLLDKTGEMIEYWQPGPGAIPITFKNTGGPDDGRYRHVGR